MQNKEAEEYAGAAPSTGRTGNSLTQSSTLRPCCVDLCSFSAFAYTLLEVLQQLST
jgi:hypothetical protein